jgi:Ca-activated chloride channel homolog
MLMFRWEDSSAFWILWILPILAGLMYWTYVKQKKQKSSFAKDDLFQKLTQNKTKKFQKTILLGVALFFLILAWINPQYGLKKEKQKVEKSDIMIALDISNSMNATDISPSRMEKAKKLISEIIRARKGDQMGLILFAGGAYLQMPLTSDYAAAELFAKTANPGMAGTQGTAIGEAIDLAMRSVKDDHQRALIILSDGEDHDDDAVSQAGKAADAGWNVFTVGVGSTEGAFVPVINDGREEYKMDEEGNPVKSAINESLLTEIADQGKGQYYRLDDNIEAIIADINTQLEKMSKRAVEIKSFTEYRSFYQYFLAIGFVLIMVYFFHDFKEKAL